MQRIAQLRRPAGGLIYFSLLLLVLFIPIKTPFYLYDEGFAVLNATRVIDQEAPYKDFWAIYPPGQLYTLAGLYKLFGASLLVSRIYDTLVRFFLVVGVFLVARKVSSPRLAFLTGLAITLVLASLGF